MPAYARDDAALDSPRTRQFHVVGRLAPGVAVGRARSELAVIHGRPSAAYPEDYPRMPIVATPLVDTVVGHVRPTLLLLLAGAALVFLVAGANVTILLLMRAESRRVEMAVRSALGATRGQLLRQTVIEAGVLGVAGVGGALILGRGLLALTNVVDPGQVRRIDEASLGPEVMAFTFVAMTAWVLAFGTGPAWQARVGRPSGFLEPSAVLPHPTIATYLSDGASQVFGNPARPEDAAVAPPGYATPVAVGAARPPCAGSVDCARSGWRTRRWRRPQRRRG